jgi:outer membrane protein assembly factor BamD (BamD/ComL family)
MTNNQLPRTDARRKKCAAHAPFGHWCFVLPSSFVIRHSSFRGAGCLFAAVCLIAALTGCQGSYVNVAKGHPTEPEANYVPNDYEPKELSTLEKLSPENIGKTMKKAVGLGPSEKYARQQFEDGEKLFEAKEYDKAAKLFAKAVNYWPDSTLEEDALFLEAESNFFADRYSTADDLYGQLIKKYTNSRYLDKTTARQFAIARYWQETDELHHRWTLVPNFTDRTQPLFDTGGHAINSYNTVRVNDPRGQLADAAIMAEANIYFKAHRWEDADYYYNLLRTDYPKSKYQLDAHLLGLQCKFRKYQGPGYNGKPLEEADQLIDQLLVQFPTELGDERERIVRYKAEVKAQRATRDIHLAQYFDNGAHYRAAKIYYAQVVKDYPQTQFAEQAKTRLASLQGLPDNPPNRIAFLTDWMEPPEKRSTAGEEETVRR